jgi:ABC-2 type transport system ATP-binding protein
MNLAIEVDALQKSFGEIEAVRGVSFEVARGEVFGFLGPNGAGKTTTINMLCTLARPTGGSALVAGHDVVRERDDVRRNIGLVFQDPTLDGYLTARQNLQLHAELYGVQSQLIEPRMQQVLEMVDLWDRRDGVVATFSGGMRRRLEIARGLMHSPRVLFLDEPTIGLDPRGQQELLGLVKQIAADRSAGVILCSHLLSEVETVCDDVVILSSGEIVASGTVSEVIGKTEQNVMRIRIPGESLEEAQRELEALPIVRRVAPASGMPGWIRVELDEAAAEDHHTNNRVLETLLRAEIPVLSFEPEGGRLQDVFLQLTAGGIR